MEQHLQREPFFAAGKYSVADIALFAYTHSAGDGGFDLKKYPAISAWLDRVRSQPRFVPAGMRGELLLKGLAFGFILAATVGPMWVLCLRRTLASGALVGLASGLGIAVADGFYGAVAAFGLTAISGFLLAYAFWIGLVGAVFLIYLGLRTLFAAPTVERRRRNPPCRFTQPSSPRSA